MAQSILDFLLYLDHTIWHFINVTSHNVVLDAIVPYLRNQWTWTPLYLFLAVFMPLNFGKKGVMWCVFFILTFTFCDSISASMLKPYFHRLRPCNDPELQKVVKLLVECGSGYSFPSSHAANHFGLAVFSGITLKGQIKKIWLIALLWAFIVAFAQVYVGVHFPLDVSFGAVIGIVIGIITGKVYNRVYNLNSRFKIQNSNPIQES
jgi:membrane-associated phospholipid phosphatase